MANSTIILPENVLTIPQLFGLLHSELILERWASGLNRRSRKPLNDSVVPGVRISFSPQTVEAQRVALGFSGARDTLSLLISGPCAKKAQEPQAHELQPVCKGPRGERKEKRHTRQRVANLLLAKQLSPRRAGREKAHAQRVANLLLASHLPKQSPTRTV